MGRPGLTVFTNSLNHALTLCRVSGNRVIMLGGEIDNNDEATFGTGTATGIDSVRADVAFIGVGGFAEDGGMTDYSIIGRRDARQDDPARAAPTCWRTRPSSLAARRSACPTWSKCAGVIVDRMPDRQLASAWTGMGWEIIVANDRKRLVICEYFVVISGSKRNFEPATAHGPILSR